MSDAHFFPRHEPTVWLRRTAEAAAMAIAARDDSFGYGIRLVVPLVPGPVRPDHLCARCYATSAPGWNGFHRHAVPPSEFRRCQFRAASVNLPGVDLRFFFELCDPCAVKEFGPRATEPLPIITIEEDSER